jgi:hypothetical protein
MEAVDPVAFVALPQLVEAGSRDPCLAAGGGDAAELLSAPEDVKALGLYPVLEGHWGSPVLVLQQERRRNASLALFSLASEVSTPFGHSSP